VYQVLDLSIVGTSTVDSAYWTNCSMSQHFFSLLSRLKLVSWGRMVLNAAGALPVTVSRVMTNTQGIVADMTRAVMN
jgi:hypothetical protein